jgi:hypothetical protein
MRRMSWPPGEGGTISVSAPHADHHRGSCRRYPQGGGAHRHYASADGPDPGPQVGVGRGGGAGQLRRGRARLILRLRSAASSVSRTALEYSNVMGCERLSPTATGW